MWSSSSFLAMYAGTALAITLLSLHQVIQRKNPYGKWWLLNLAGGFVWGDGVLFGFFWTLVTVFCLLVNDGLLFIRAQLLFWIVRALGEIGYWLLQQFATKKRDLPETLWLHRWFPGESVWFVYQISWQLVLVVCLLAFWQIRNW